ncbi:unnamed protein product [Gongylonema pulchrum]|uniref:Transmembrane protein n=1 Tax=Gongylonema pulchrum TaxID=637853 RepID=A0A183DTF3_9BILA|nr:unnamed protein product [Gongylonema pulchrum]
MPLFPQRNSDKRGRVVVYHFFNDIAVLQTNKSVVDVLQIFVLHCAIPAGFIALFMHLEKVHSTAYVIDITALFISLLNFLLCLIEAVKVTYSIVTKNRARLTSGQPSLRTDRSKLLHFFLHIVEPRSSPSSRHVSSPDAANRNFLTQWLSALHYGDRRQSSQSYLSQNLSADSSGTSFFTSSRHSVSFDDNIFFKHSTPISSGRSPYTERHSSHSVSLSAKVGSSPNSRPNSSFQTSRQLEEYLRTSPLCEESSCNSMPPHSASFGPEVSAAYSLRLSPPFRFLRSGSTNYEMGTAMFADEQGKSTSDENSVVSLVTGSRIVATEKRISLSPIPLNLIDADNELISGNDKGVASDGTDVARNAYNDSITFQKSDFLAKCIWTNTKKRFSGTTPPLLRRSETNESRRTISTSPQTQTESFFSKTVQLNETGSSQIGKQIPITSSEILSQYKLDAETLAFAERNLRSWICQTILRPLIAKIDEVNAVLAKDEWANNDKSNMRSLA